MEPTTLRVTTPTATYDIVVGPGMLQTLPCHLDALGLHGTCWLISDSAVFPHYGAELEQHIHADGGTIHSYVVASGESSKDLATVSHIYDWMMAGGVERRDVVLALGGGVVGDLAGFVAATVLRGIAFIQVPTTLLAMVDSALGGKTGVNHAYGKNLIGAFHQPRLVVSDTTTLASLPTRELNAGWAEVIKHGVIRDAELFTGLEQVVSADTTTPITLAHFAEPHLSAIIRRAAAVKVAIVSADEREHGERMVLNYGHTMGHALETAVGYGTLLHGEAVAIGMHLEAQIAERLGLIGADIVLRQQRLLGAYGLPTAIPPKVTPAQLLALILRDKKVSARRIRWVLPTALGATTIRDDVPETMVRAIIETALADHAHHTPASS